MNHVADCHLSIPVNTEADIQIACRAARQLAERMGFSRITAYYIATAASELAANLLFHGGGGLLQAQTLTASHLTDAPLGLELCAEDHGTGIADLALALTEGYSTGKGLGCGLPGVKRLMDELMIDSAPGRGTCVKAIKWRR